MFTHVFNVRPYGHYSPDWLSSQFENYRKILDFPAVISRLPGMEMIFESGKECATYLS